MVKNKWKTMTNRQKIVKSCENSGNNELTKTLPHRESLKKCEKVKK